MSSCRLDIGLVELLAVNEPSISFEDAASRRSLRLRSQRSDDRKDQPGKIGILHPHRLGVRTRVENDLLVPRQRVVDPDRHVEQISERRHRTELTIREQTRELSFLRDLKVPFAGSGASL